MGVEDILDLTVPQFQDRIMDVGEISSMMYGEGKGRRTLDKEQMRQAIASKGIRPPKRI